MPCRTRIRHGWSPALRGGLIGTFERGNVHASCRSSRTREPSRAAACTEARPLHLRASRRRGLHGRRRRRTIMRLRLTGLRELDTRPSLHWPEPTMIVERHPDHGPVLVTVEYHIDPAQGREFSHAMQAVRQFRRRDGAIRWGLFEDAATPGKYRDIRDRKLGRASAPARALDCFGSRIGDAGVRVPIKAGSRLA